MNFFALSVMHKSAVPDIYFSFIDADDVVKPPESIIISESIY